MIHTFLIYITTTPRVRLCLAHVAFSSVQPTGERGMLVAHLHNGKRKSFSTYIIRSPQSNSPHNLCTFAHTCTRNSRENIKKHTCVHNYITTIYLVFEIRMYLTLTFSTTPKRTPGVFFLPRTACRRGTPRTSPTRSKLAENLWNTFERLRATWISVEPRSLLVTCHDPSTFRKIGSKNATNFWN